MASALLSLLSRLPPGVSLDDALGSMQPADLADVERTLRYDWSLWGYPYQMPPEEPWRYWFMTGGRGSGKTRAAAQLVVKWMATPGTRVLLVGPEAGHGRKVMVDGDSGILACAPPWLKMRYLPALKRIQCENGSLCELHSGDTPRTMRGPQYHKAWIEELFHWRINTKTGSKEPPGWSEGVRYCLRLGKSPQAVVTSTPRSTDFCHDLLLGSIDDATGERPIRLLEPGDPNRYDVDGFPWSWTHEGAIDVDGKKLLVRSHVARWPTENNRSNLAPGKPEEWRKEWGTSRLGQQELDGAILFKSLGSLFSRELLDRCEVPGVPTIVRTLVAVDPTRSDSPVDEAGIIVGGLGADGHAYIWDDCTVQGSPSVWAAAALSAKDKYGAAAIVYEKNRMPETTQQLIKTKDKSVRWIEVFATESKQTRAEPVSALYEQGRVHHVVEPRADRRSPHPLAKVEDEMIKWDPRARMPSPNRMDALVWLVTALLLGDQRAPLRLV